MRLYARYFVQQNTREAYLHWSEVVGSRHKVLAEDRDPLDVSLPFWLKISRGHRVRWLQEGTKKG